MVSPLCRGRRASPSLLCCVATPLQCSYDRFPQFIPKDKSMQLLRADLVICSPHGSRCGHPYQQASTGSLGPGSTRGTCPPALSLLRPQGITSLTKLCTKHVRSSVQGPSVFGMSGTPNASWKKSRGTPFLNLVAEFGGCPRCRTSQPWGKSTQPSGGW